uniref:Cysteine-rich DPF motif domain-containing protein 1 n=2 Tax=Canis lupus familiaris TaxID=9615 RepID=A0A8I3NAD7_CANLF
MQALVRSIPCYCQASGNGGSGRSDLWRHLPSCSLLEESYVMKDPFTPDKDRFLVLGSRCSLCSRLVCVSPECSLFYSKRFCLPCVRDNMDAFPQEIRQDLEKRKAPSKRPASQPGSRTVIIVTWLLGALRRSEPRGWGC